MDININLNVNSEPLVEMAQRANEANSNAQNLNNTLKDKTPESQITKNGTSLRSTGVAMKGLSQAVGGFDKLAGTAFSGANDGVKALASSFLGLGRVLPLVRTAFAAFNAVLATNPFVGIAIAISAVVVGIGFLLNGIGLLQPIFDAIGIVVEALIRNLRNLTDWLGLTSEEMEDGSIASDKYANALKRVNAEAKKNIREAERKVEMARAEKKSIEEIAKLEQDASIEKQVQYIKLRDEANKLIVAKKRELATLTIGTAEYKEVDKELTDATIARDEALTGLADAEQEWLIIAMKAKDDAVKRDEEYNRKSIEDAKKRAQAELKALEEREKLKIISTDKLTLTRIQIEIDAEENIFNFKKSKAKELEITESALALMEKEKMIRVDELKEKLKGANSELRVIFNETTRLFEVVRKQADEMITKVPDNEEYIKISRQRILANRQFQIDSIKEVLDFDNLSYNERINGIKSYYEAKNSLLEAQRQIELSAVEEDSKEAAIINQKYDALIKANKNSTAADIREINKEVLDASFALANAGLTGLETMTDIFFQNKLKAAKGNAVEEEKIARQQFKVNKAFQIGQAVMNGLQSVLAITSTAVDPTGVTTALRVAAQIALNVGTIAKIAATQFQGGGSNAAGTQGATTPAISVPTTPSFNLFGQGNQMNVSSAQPTTTVSDPQGNILSVIAQVSETEISAVQARNRRYSNSAEL